MTTSNQALEYSTVGTSPVMCDAIGAIDLFFRQVAHRALSVAIWLITARVVFALWPRNFDFTFYLLPATFGCLDVALMAVVMSLWFASRSRHDPRETRGMLWVSLVLLVPTVVWMVLPHFLRH
jgi:hypothetical protein